MVAQPWLLVTLQGHTKGREAVCYRGSAPKARELQGAVGQEAGAETR